MIKIVLVLAIVVIARSNYQNLIQERMEYRNEALKHPNSHLVDPRYLEFYKYAQKMDNYILRKVQNNYPLYSGLQDTTDMNTLLPWNQYIPLYSTNNNSISKIFTNDCKKSSENSTRYFVSADGYSRDFNYRDWGLLNIETYLENLKVKSNTWDLVWKDIYYFIGANKYDDIDYGLGCQIVDPYNKIMYRENVTNLDSELPFHLDVGGEGRHPSWDTFWVGYFNTVNLNPAKHITTSNSGLIPRRIYGCAEDIPLSENFVDVITADGVPVTVDGAKEFLRVLDPKGYIGIGGLTSKDWESLINDKDPRIEAMKIFEKELGPVLVIRDDAFYGPGFYRWCFTLGGWSGNVNN
eukprot:TRINITY_DN9431_c0_g1_i1.p1 TRINITY_DN9431_c0_g1~~TRINITY_DN9431_c0_g1_i1.p1  ORF type:complete len:351 (+),score=80.08 TRINITY_DN9431_c0_g1_i1:13-1065(+)